MQKLLTFEKEAFSLTAIQKAAYRGSKFFTAQLETSERTINCTLYSCIGTDEEAFLFAIENFQKDVIDYQLREAIALQTEPVRNLILGLTFSKTELMDEQV